MGIFRGSYDTEGGKVLGKGGIYLIRKFFGIILLAISVKLFMSNITLLMEQIEASTKAI